ncbi:MAG: Crp/Fnr family transcriptional regulator [Variovorax paradoxus]|uniref:Crp/Fnr family transcriptional regulator n=1 Tax=Variovorax paradoxus TaxID=34073 RepID=A0A2W5QFL6_VARPD|nr:MAG: Crp/Fnr family transcriptional regulator [Variovorax paradoxus]
MDIGDPIGSRLRRLGEQLSPVRRVMHAGETIFQAGERFTSLYLVNAGLFKLINTSADGREQVVGFKFRGDWIGFDGIADAHHKSDAVAMDTSEVWVLPYEQLLARSAEQAGLLAELHAAMSREIAHDRESMMALCTLPADARVADFLRYWAESLATRGMRTDEIALRLTRAEIGNYLGMTLESVSRALSKLVRAGVIAFCSKGRRDLRIPDVEALGRFVQRYLVPASSTLQ